MGASKVIVLLSEAINLFLREVRYAPATLLIHKRYLSYFVNFIGNPKLEDIKIFDITKFEAQLKKTKWTIWETKNSIKVFLKYFYIKYDYPCLNPEKIENHEPPCGSYGYVRPEDIEKILKSLNQSEIVNLRNYAIILTFYSTGMRCSELTNLKIKQIDWIHGEANIIGAKVEKPRKIFFTNRCLRILKKYLDLRDDDNPYLFVTHTPKQYKHDRITKKLGNSMVRKFMREISKKTGIHIHPHALRKSCATTAYNQTNDLLRVQKLMGHSRPETTSQYAIVDNLKEFHSRALGQNHEFIYQAKKGGELQIEIKGWCKEGGSVTAVKHAIQRAVDNL